MIFKLEYVRDVIGNNYIGIKIPKYLVDKYLKDLKEYIEDDDKYDILTRNQINRDNNAFHITVINVMEMNQIFASNPKVIDNLLNFKITDLQLLGLGEVKSFEKEAYFVVVKSKMVDDIRNNVGLDQKDLHITLGFNPKDIFNKPKNQVIKLKSPIEKKVTKYLEDNDGKYNFVFNISNFDEVYADDEDLEFIKLTDTLLEVSVRNTKFQIGLIDGELTVLTQSIYIKKND